MDLSMLLLPEPQRHLLEAELDRLHKNYEDDITNLIDAATDEMERASWFERQSLVMQYTEDASQLANEYYMAVRDSWQRYGQVTFPNYAPDIYNPYETLYHQVGGFSGTDWNGLNFTQIMEERSRAGLRVDDLWPDMQSIDDWQQFIGEMIDRSIRDTTQHNRDTDPTHPRWARVPRGSNPCAFCAMLASRGFAYTEKDTADFGSSFHKGKCRCVPVCSWGRDRIFGYDQQTYLNMWDKAKEASRNSDDSKTLEHMRRLYPSQLKDGVYPKPTLPWNESKKLLSMRGETKGTRASWIARQEKAGVPIAEETLELHEIVFLERFKEAGQHYQWIKKSSVGESTNDFHWEDRHTDAELKSMATLKYGRIADRISDAVRKAHTHGVTKDVFIIDLGETKIPAKLETQLAGYNQKRKETIRELWVMDASGLHQIQLK